MHELQKLCSELDVTDASGAALHLTISDTSAPHLLLGTCLHGPHLPQVIRAEGSAPQDERGRRRPCSAELVVSGHRHRSQQCLPLPGLSPAIPVGLIARQAPHQRPVATFGPEVRVDTKGAPGHIEHRASCPFEERRVAFADQDDVDVAGVVQLITAELAHAHDNKSPVTVEVGQHHGMSVCEDIASHRADRRGRSRQRHGAGEVERGYSEQLTPLPLHDLIPIRGGPGLRVREHVEGSRVLLEQTSQAPAGSEHRDESCRDVVVVQRQPVCQVGPGALETVEGSAHPLWVRAALHHLAHERQRLSHSGSLAAQTNHTIQLV